ncbi:HAD family hydrolase [Halopiger aswanensis]|uniref:Putative hydrolase of the HAD superfamily n=1 Tax=Halopiger aswanensis TaxID=148449 RepID=A0A3R7DCU6_9EURY|nr:HAD family hydrolase [Halopiger aswanensis]RKD98261.1 putative hydrolase of the HAD superfamily [Halopiger aswanensis]
MTAIVFDVDGTLLRFDRPYREIVAGAIETVRGDAPAAWLDAYEEAFFESFLAFESEPVERAFGRIDGCSDPEPYATALLEAEIEALSPPDGVHDDLERLTAETDAGLGVLTNGVRDWQLAKLRAFDLEDYFDAAVASYKVGVHKPATEPYRALEERLPARRYVMVGDSDDDIDGAAQAGWTPYRYDGGGFGDLPAAAEVDQ